MGIQAVQVKEIVQFGDQFGVQLLLLAVVVVVLLPTAVDTPSRLKNLKVQGLGAQNGFLPNPLVGEAGVPTSLCTKALLRVRNEKLLQFTFMMFF